MVRIGVDIDGVVYDFESKFRDYLHQKIGKPLEEMPPSNTWYFYSEQWGVELDEYLELISKGVADKEIFWRGNQIEDSLWGVSELYRSGFEIVFITARGFHGITEECRQATKYWLDSNGYPYHEIIVDMNKTKHDLDILIDDSPENYTHRMEAGQKTLVFDRPWNKLLHNAPRAKGWEEVVKKIQKDFM